MSETEKDTKAPPDERPVYFRYYDTWYNDDTGESGEEAWEVASYYTTGMTVKALLFSTRDQEIEQHD